MSLISKKGSTIANELKWQNNFTFQHWLYTMLGTTFSGEPYCIYKNRQIKREKGLVGIETRSGTRWPNKSWGGYDSLIKLIEKAGYHCLVLSQKKNITDYLDEIARCSFLVSGDTLAMHVAMAYQVPSIAIFNCTSPAEIHDYGTCKKMISPLLQESFYSREFSRAVTESISSESVFTEFIRQAKLMESPAKV
jgi:heptosyltransferase-2